jgi:hypothetical protein
MWSKPGADHHLRIGPIAIGKNHTLVEEGEGNWGKKIKLGQTLNKLDRRTCLCSSIQYPRSIAMIFGASMLNLT